MKTIFLTIFTAFVLSTTITAQYWQQAVDYRIDVSLNDKEHTLDGFERLIYTNNSKDTLSFIWFHLWPNAYKNDKTAFSDQLLVNGNTNFYFSSKEQKGYINRLDFKVNGITAKTEDHPNYSDVIKLILPAPLAPAQQITISTPFHVKLPYNFSRGGYDGNSFQITQWYPKPAVYDAQGWHEMPYLDQGEFYSEFGNFDVRITVPKNYVVAATGLLQNEDEKKWMLNRSVEREVKSQESRVGSQEPKVKSRKPVTTNKKKVASSKKPATKKEQATPTTNEPIETKTLQYLQSNVHDFAWFANPHFVVNRDTCQLSSGKVIDVYTYYTAEEQKTWKNSLQFAKAAVRFYSDEVGEYPYDVVSGVQGPKSFGGGMEYPTITVISPANTEKSLDVTLAHEIGHNWFYGILGSNERAHPWMDEGINSFYEYKYSKGRYAETNNLLNILFNTKAIQQTDQSIENPASEFSSLNYGLIVYHKTAKWLQSIEKKLGEARFKTAMQAYYNQWKFKHPQPKDLKAFFEPLLAEETNNYFSQLNNIGSLPAATKPLSWKVSTVFGLKKYVDNPSKNLLLLSPAIGANSYDKFMIGGLITNYKLPPSKFQFLLAPLYGTGSKSLNGLGKASYSIYSQGKIRRTEIFLNGSSFSMDEFTDSLNNKFITRFEKLVPGIKLTFKEKNARSTVRKYLQWKTFLIREGSFRFGTDTLFNGIDTGYQQISIQKEKRVLNQLQFSYENLRALYPFNVLLKIEQVEDLIRPTITTNYFFNYPKEGGLNVRLFAGKIFYTKGRNLFKSYSTDRYHLNMTGPNGYEDYTYSNYFVGRNKFEGLASQQIMLRDGGFKFRTNLLGNEVGKTDRWLGALNFTSTIPKNINPLSVLPFKIPLRVFADIGTYADAWDRDSGEDHFLFDAGLQISLLNEAVEIYLPLVYSKVYSDYYHSYLSDKRFLKTISFSINLDLTALKKLAHEVDF